MDKKGQGGVIAAMVATVIAASVSTNMVATTVREQNFSGINLVLGNTTVTFVLLGILGLITFGFIYAMNNY